MAMEVRSMQTTGNDGVERERMPDVQGAAGRERATPARSGEKTDDRGEDEVAEPNPTFQVVKGKIRTA
jgi:hypothetical protein